MERPVVGWSAPIASRPPPTKVQMLLTEAYDNEKTPASTMAPSSDHVADHKSPPPSPVTASVATARSFYPAGDMPSSPQPRQPRQDSSTVHDTDVITGALLDAEWDAVGASRAAAAAAAAAAAEAHHHQHVVQPVPLPVMAEGHRRRPKTATTPQRAPAVVPRRPQTAAAGGGGGGRGGGRKERQRRWGRRRAGPALGDERPVPVSQAVHEYVHTHTPLMAQLMSPLSPSSALLLSASWCPQRRMCLPVLQPSAFHASCPTGPATRFGAATALTHPHPHPPSPRPFTGGCHWSLSRRQAVEQSSSVLR